MVLDSLRGSLNYFLIAQRPPFLIEDITDEDLLQLWQGLTITPFDEASEEEKLLHRQHIYGCDTNQHILKWRSATPSMAYKIKQLKSLSNADDDAVLLENIRAAVERDLAQFQFFQTISYYLEQMPASRGGTHHDNYYSGSYDSYSAGLRSCLDAIAQPIGQITEYEREFLDAPFGIFFATRVPWQRTSSYKDVSFFGPLKLGEDIPYLYVPEDRIPFVEQWIDENLPGENKPQVLSITDFPAP